MLICTVGPSLRIWASVRMPEESPVRPIKALLAVVVLFEGSALHPSHTEALEELHLQPSGYHPLGQ
jgi:hypothetical protein